MNKSELSMDEISKKVYDKGDGALLKVILRRGVVLLIFYGGMQKVNR